MCDLPGHELGGYSDDRSQKSQVFLERHAIRPSQLIVDSTGVVRSLMKALSGHDLATELPNLRASAIGYFHDDR